jgi:hypothetical protein
VKFVATKKKDITTNFCSPLSFVTVFGSGMGNSWCTVNTDLTKLLLDLVPGQVDLARHVGHLHPAVRLDNPAQYGYTHSELPFPR